MTGVAAVVLVLVAWGIPIGVTVYVIRALGTIVLGLRSINTAVQRMATSVEELVDAERRRI